MQRCLQLAEMASGYVAPNPLVGAMVVHNGKIIGEGYHEKWGGPHAEVNAIAAVEDQSLLPESTLYVNLEPCCHHGKTPPCTSLILDKKIPKVVIAALDPNPAVAGNGAQILKEHGVEVETGIHQQEAEWLNRFFYTFHQKKRPYVVLKWAQSADGFMGKQGQKIQISNPLAQRLVHKWRSEISAIMVGSNTALIDNPLLTVRLWAGPNPTRVVLDQSGRLHGDLRMFNKEAKSILIGNNSNLPEWVKVFGGSTSSVGEVLEVLYNNNLNAVLIEGGATLLSSFIGSGLWDEARVLTSPHFLKTGIMAPNISGDLVAEEMIDDNRLTVIKSA
jgi:diaminohydroxyphosphoribosylaminopyrimidine deaminase/5-amino-6-(5-phosphoribosylamino)uracil reductase